MLKSLRGRRARGPGDPLPVSYVTFSARYGGDSHITGERGEMERRRERDHGDGESIKR